ncbi:MAG: tetratricopeptide repeat protein [Prevotella sp.]
MQKKNLLILSAASMVVLSSCSKLGALSSDYFTVDPNPLETTAGQVPATINGMFPEKYMKKKATVTVIPELRFEGQAVQGAGATFQGEKVEGNDQTISYKVGGNYTMKTNFQYVPEMQKSELYLTFDAYIGKKKVDVPAVKVANGIIATSELSKRTVKQAQASLAPDAYQRIIEHKQDANIKFLIQQATIRKTELANNSVKEFVELLKKINADKEGLNLKNVEVSAYASPDGGVSLNNKLAYSRQDNTEKYVKQTLKQTNVEAPIDAQYTAQDWEGFQELVKVSDIQDKDVILRVLSMYNDPEEREQQIKNMSAVFRELADGILPELRRARLTLNYEVIGRSDEQIVAQFNDDATQLSVEELLYASTLTDNASQKEAYFKKAAELYNDARAYNNLAALAYAKGDLNSVKSYAQQALKVDPTNADANANLGLAALASGKVSEAEQYIAKGANANGINEILGNLNLMKGNYAQADQNFAKVVSNSAALAQILNKNYSAANATLNNIKNGDATTEYLKSILNARLGKNTDAAAALKKAIIKDSSFAKYAENDLELINVSK